MTLTSILSETSTKDLVRILNSQKAYVYFEISVFNIGTIITPKLTDTYKQLNQNTWNGYDCFIENCSTTKYYIVKTLENRELTPYQKTIYNKYN